MAEKYIFLHSIVKIQNISESVLGKIAAPGTITD